MNRAQVGSISFMGIALFVMAESAAVATRARRFLIDSSLLNNFSFNWTLKNNSISLIKMFFWPLRVELHGDHREHVMKVVQKFREKRALSD